MADSARADDKALTTTVPRESISGSGYRALRALEPELFIYRDTPEKWKKYSTPEGMKEAKALAAKSLAYPIELAIGKLRPRKDGQADQGFAVRGEGRDALPGVYDVFVKGAQPSQTFATGTPISVVFFAPPSMPVRLDRVERTNHNITIRYMLLTSNLRTQPWHLSIIPLGKLPAGKYQVEMLRSHEREKESNLPEFPPVPPNSERGIICQPFSFVVADGLN